MFRGIYYLKILPPLRAYAFDFRYHTTERADTFIEFFNMLAVHRDTELS